MAEAILIPAEKNVLLWQEATAGAQQREPLMCASTSPNQFRGCAPKFCRKEAAQTQGYQFQDAVLLPQKASE